MVRFLKCLRLWTLGLAVLVAAIDQRFLVAAVRMRRARGGEEHATAWLQLMENVGVLGPKTATDTSHPTPAVAAVTTPAANVSPHLNPSSPYTLLSSSNTLVPPSNQVATVVASTSPASEAKPVTLDSLEKTAIEASGEDPKNVDKRALEEPSDAEESTEETTEDTTESSPTERTKDTPDATLGKAVKETAGGGSEPIANQATEETTMAPSGDTERNGGHIAEAATEGIKGSAVESTAKKPGPQIIEAIAKKAAEQTAGTSITSPSIAQPETTAPLPTGGSSAFNVNTTVVGTTTTTTSSTGSVKPTSFGTTTISLTGSVKPTAFGTGVEAKGSGESPHTAEDTARSLSTAIKLNREKKKTRSLLERKRQEQLAQVEKDRALLRDSLIWTENMLHSVATLARKADALAEGVTDEFFKDVHFSAIPLEDLPLALQPNISAANMAATLNCPVHCDPTICDNAPSGFTQCLKVDYATSEDDGALGAKTTTPRLVRRQHTCLPFEDSAEYRCPSQSDRCAMVSPRKRIMLRFPVSTPSASKFNKIVVEGYNMHPCIKILLLPAGVHCDRETVPSMVAATGRVMGFGGTTAFPEVYNGQKAVFSKVEILEPGTFDVCLLQFAKKPKNKAESSTASSTESVVVLTTTNIGKVVAVPDSEWNRVAPTPSASGASVAGASERNIVEAPRAINATKRTL